MIEGYNIEIQSLFDNLNKNCEYLVLRNWDDVFSDSIYGSGHEDIDVLCRDLRSFVLLTDAHRIHSDNHLDNFVVPCGKKQIRFDIRWVGDGYYPSEWESSMLQNRVLSDNGVYIMSALDYCYSLTYHALFQKRILSNEYQGKIREAFHAIGEDSDNLDENDFLKKLHSFIVNHKYVVTIPHDPAVYLNWNNIKSIGYLWDFRLILRRNLFKINMLWRRAADKVIRVIKDRL